MKRSPEIEAAMRSLQHIRESESELREHLANRLAQIEAEAREIRRLLTSREYLGAANEDGVS